MIIFELSYLKPISEVDFHLSAHREFLQNGYEQGKLLMSGPLEPRTGGLIVTLMTNRIEAENFIKNDPFHQHGIAKYRLVEFNPVKYHPAIAALVTS